MKNLFLSVKLSRMPLLVSLLLILASGDRILYAKMAVERIDLPNQMVVLVSEDRSLPLVTVNLLVDAGARRDPARRGGLANLTAESLLLGTETRNISQLNEMLDFMGTSLEVSCGYDYVILTLKSLKSELEGGFDLFMETVTAPAFPAEEISREKKIIVGQIESQKDDPSEQAQKMFRQAVFVTGPYDRPPDEKDSGRQGPRRLRLQPIHRAHLSGHFSSRPSDRQFLGP